MRMRPTRAATVLAGLVLVCARLRAETYDPGVLPRRGIDFYDPAYFYATYDAMDWEIKAMYPHDNGHLGTYQVNDIVNVSYVVGVVGDRASLSAKASGNDPLAEVWIYEDGEFRETVSMVPCAD